MANSFVHVDLLQVLTATRSSISGNDALPLLAINKANITLSNGDSVQSVGQYLGSLTPDGDGGDFQALFGAAFLKVLGPRLGAAALPVLGLAPDAPLSPSAGTVINKTV